MKIPRRKRCLPVENTQWKFCLLSRRVGRAGRTVVRPSSCCVESCNEGTGKLRNFKTRCQYYVSTLERCPHKRHVNMTVSTSEVSIQERCACKRCPHNRGATLHGCPHKRGFHINGCQLWLIDVHFVSKHKLYRDFFFRTISALEQCPCQICYVSFRPPGRKYLIEMPKPFWIALEEQVCGNLS